MPFRPPRHPKTCAHCGELFTANSGVQKTCEDCRTAYHLQRQKDHYAGKREERGMWALGSPRECVECKAGFPYRGGPGLRCKPCQTVRNKEKQLARVRESPHRPIYRKRERDRAMFGGNRDAVFARDNGKCRRCGSADAPCIHHIDNRGAGWPAKDRNNAIGNLITLCNQCHQALHTATEKVLYVRHIETVHEVLAAFLRGEEDHCVNACSAASESAVG